MVVPVPSGESFVDSFRVGPIEQDMERQVAPAPSALANERNLPVVLGTRLHGLIVKCDDRQGTPLEFAVKINQVRHAPDTGTAPVPPEVQDNHLSAEVGELDRPARVEINRVNLRRRLTDELLGDLQGR